MEPAGSTLFYALVVFLLLAPLYNGGHGPLPLLLLEVAAIALLVVTAGGQRAPAALPRTFLVGAGVLLVYPLVQLLPLPGALWRALPGHDEYAAVLDRFASHGAWAVWRAISIVPSATEYGWLALLPPLACLLAVLQLQPAHCRLLLLAMVAFTGLEALLGLLQVLLGGDPIFPLRIGQILTAATGTFVDRNHLAAMLAMTLPVAVGWLAYSIRHGRHLQKSRRRKSAMPQLLSQRLFVVLVLALILLCLMLTRSRVGIAAALVGLAASAIVLMRTRARAPRAKRIGHLLIGVGILLAVAIGVSPILERIEPKDLTTVAVGRGVLPLAVLQAATDFLPFGSGLSTFADVFPRYQAGKFGGRFAYPNNDYLQAFMELGLAAPVIIALLLGAYAARTRELLRVEGGASFTLLQMGAAVAMLPLIVHSAFDSALQSPAIAMWFAALTGVVFHEGAGASERDGDERHGAP